MTIAAAYLTSEGVVLGADSTTTIAGGGGVAQLLDHAQKVFEIGTDSNFALCTWGSGRVADTAHRTITAQVADRIDTNTANVVQIVDAVINVVSETLHSAGLPPIGFGYFVGGRDRDRAPQCCRLGVSVKDGALTTHQQWMGVGEARFEGAPDYFMRVFRGYAMDLPGHILAEIRTAAPQLPPDFDALFATAFGTAAAKVASVGYNDLPIREAIDYIHTYLYITVKAFKFRYGPPPCGGPIELAYVSTDRPFRWVRHKQFDSAIMEHANDRLEE